ncbi:3-isopropylmalate dehydrogenase [Pullulanibacillus sp. KACC 23026]|uniref:3-isopropylmalate dehydrogenase n=1 Tax=Pullulanibacillus sp. KACC 23026 TaxID=3028315 RepID=UPI0023B177A0|nr:3-isopropylmalate dehydrogenase [Pullulanibacillus sp. KACC 23026]WEG11427.1 3-isopropylmalate dehydrogenase [Pullulanibacillus sp. KACC 23026]
MEKKIAVLPGDGIGPEVMEGALKVLSFIGDRFKHSFKSEKGLIGGAAIDAEGTPLPEKTVDLCQSSDAVLLGAVGGPKWDQNPAHLRPEKGLLGIRKALGLFANLRPVTLQPALIEASSLKPSIIEKVDLMIVRELTGGIYFGEPSGMVDDETVVDTLRYTKGEIERVVRTAFELARKRRNKLTSVDKANVLSSSKVWRQIVDEVAKEYPDVTVSHQLVDSAAMKLIQDPSQFDVMVMENLFGDILSDEASMLTGSLGMLPSASLRSDSFGLYEPVHGSAPDIAGQNKANPLAMLLSVSMMLRYSFQMVQEAEVIEAAINQVLQEGYRTFDLYQGVGTRLGTTEMIQQILSVIDQQLVGSN